MQGYTKSIVLMTQYDKDVNPLQIGTKIQSNTEYQQHVTITTLDQKGKGEKLFPDLSEM